MLFGKLDHPDTYRSFLSNRMWAQAFDWLRQLPKDPNPGIHEIEGKTMFANIHGYETLDRSGCNYEAHRKYVDLQYCIQGGELIEWCDLEGLKPSTEYDAAKDLQFFEDVHSISRAHMTPGCFVTFLSHEAHMPKLADGVHPRVFKLVIKLELEALLKGD